MAYVTEKIPMKDIIDTFKLKIVLSGMGVVKFRLSLASKIIKFACFVAGVSCSIEVKEKDTK